MPSYSHQLSSYNINHTRALFSHLFPRPIYIPSPLLFKRLLVRVDNLSFQVNKRMEGNNDHKKNHVAWSHDHLMVNCIGLYYTVCRTIYCFWIIRKIIHTWGGNVATTWNMSPEIPSPDRFLKTDGSFAAFDIPQSGAFHLPFPDYWAKK